MRRQNVKKIIDRGDHTVGLERDEEGYFVFTINEMARVSMTYIVNGKAVPEEDFLKEALKSIDKEIKKHERNKKNKN